MNIKRKCTVCGAEFTVKGTDDYKICSDICSRKYTSDYQKVCWDGPDHKLIAKAYDDTTVDLEWNPKTHWGVLDHKLITKVYGGVLKDLESNIKVERFCYMCGTEFRIKNTIAKKTCSISCSKEYSKYMTKKYQKTPEAKAIAKAKRHLPENKAKRETLEYKSRRRELNKIQREKNNPMNILRQCTICANEFKVGAGSFKKTCSTECSKKHNIIMHRAYNPTDKSKARAKELRDTPENKAKLKTYRDRPKNKARAKELRKLRKEMMK